MVDKNITQLTNTATRTYDDDILYVASNVSGNYADYKISASNVTSKADGQYTYYGTDNDVSIGYDGTDLVISGANVSANNYGMENVDHIDFNLTSTVEHSEGRLHWNDTAGTLEIGMPGGEVLLQVGQEQLIKITNKTGVTLTNGQIVHVDGAQGSRPTVALSQSNVASKARACAIMTEDVNNNNSGYAATFGLVRDINTNDYTAGSMLYLSNVAGQFTDTSPNAPEYEVKIGVVLKQSSTEGIILFNPFPSYAITDLSDVDGTPLTKDGQILIWNNSASYFDPSDEILLYHDGTDVIFSSNGSGVATDIIIKTGANKTTEWETSTYDDLPPTAIINAKLGATAPTLDTLVGDIEAYTFDNTNDYVIGATEITHKYKEGTTILPHIHWATNGTDGTDRTVKWNLKYSIADGDGTAPFTSSFASASNCSAEATIPAGTNASSHIITGLDPDISGSGIVIGAYIVWRLERLPSSGTEPSNDPFAIAVGFHVEQDTIGSRQLYIK